MIDNEHYQQQIEAGIRDYGVFLQAVSNACTCAECGSDPQHTHGDAGYSDIEDGFIYTIGHRARRRPDLVALCGPKPGEPPMTAGELWTQIQQLGGLINYMVAHWQEKPVLAGQHCATDNGRIYQVIDHPGAVAHAISTLTIQASNYYGTEDYPLLVLLPSGWRHH